MSKIIQEWLNDQIGVKRKKSMPVLSFPSTSLMGISVTELIGKSELQAKGMKMIADRLGQHDGSFRRGGGVWIDRALF